MATVTELICYPVKSCAGISLPASALTPAGLEHDRAFLVIGPDGGFRSQRRDPRLALIHPELTEDGLCLRANGFDHVMVRVDLTAPRRPVTLFGVGYQGIDQGDEVAAWLTSVLGVPSRLVRVPPEHQRVTDGLVPGTSYYADSCPVHVLSTASLADLNDRIGADGGTPLPMNRFRPNIVLAGWPPYREEQPGLITIGDTEIGYAKPAVRCAITLVDQDTGQRSGKDPIRTLSRYHRDPAGGVVFGAKFAVLRPGRLAVGMVAAQSAQPRPAARFAER
jgi:uncharacterized protein